MLNSSSSSSSDLSICNGIRQNAQMKGSNECALAENDKTTHSIRGDLLLVHRHRCQSHPRSKMPSVAQAPSAHGVVAMETRPQYHGARNLPLAQHTITMRANCLRVMCTASDDAQSSPITELGTMKITAKKKRNSATQTNIKSRMHDGNLTWRAGILFNV